MQTRRQKQVARTEERQAESHSTTMEDDLMRDSNSDSIRDDGPMEVEASEPELPVTPVKTRRRLSESNPAVESPKRTKAKSTTLMTSSVLQKGIRTMVIPHSAILTQIVWVFDEKYQWWPGKIKPYPPLNNQAKVARFGSVKPKTITVDCVETSILSFEHASKEQFRQAGKLSSHTHTFQEAYKEASAEQLKDDDGLPSMDDIFNHLSTPLATPSPPSQKDTVCHKTAKAGIEYVPDPSLTMPGEWVLAQAERSLYYPGRVKSFNNKTNKYKVELATGHCPSLERKRFYTQYQREFQTCPLGEMTKELDQSFADPELESDVKDLYPDLYAIIAGTYDEAGRLRAFLQGGKAKNQLAQRVGAGEFTHGQDLLIRRILEAEFLPDLCTTMRTSSLIEVGPTVKGTASTKSEHNGLMTAAATAVTKTGSSPMKRAGDITINFSDSQRIQFVMDVLFPETITRLTMRRKRISYADADKSVLERRQPYSTDPYWVDDILAARESFLDGSKA